MRQCPECQEIYNDTWKACLKDDSPLGDIAEQELKKPERFPGLAKKREEERYKNVGGWLGLFVWSLLLGGPIGFVMVMYTLLTGNGYFIYPTGLPIYLNIVYACLVFSEIVAAILLLRPKVSSVLFVRGVLLLWGVFRAASIYIVMDRGTNEIISALLAFSTEFIWLLYFFFSKRVRIRYYPEPVIKEAPKEQSLYDLLKKMQ